ncbi:TonB family protein [Telmatospirillum sp.]|uniref:energy transducer TonB family protein n=1 Tax=Telmatospirillum sp. TaxID=2079197 RepID=UPI002843C54D|nr:TonB family protein [Telmatospirillum sp.]MDR3436872.1 TonB family protein [Telmatospirillum sp.]
MNAVFRHREWLASGYAVVAMLAFAFAPVPKLQAPKLPDESMMQVTLEQLPEPEPEPVKQVVQPVSQPPMPVQPAPVSPPKPVAPPLAKPKPQRAPVLAPSAVQQVAPSEAASGPAKDVAVTEPAPTPTASPAPAAQVAPAASDGEEKYVSRLHGYLDSIKRYPTSREARLEHPTGEAVVWFVLDHQGNLIDAGIEKGSGAMMLDQAALSTVRRGEYKPFPPDAWGGAATHRFSVRLDFSFQQ